jgi:signal transduction histidine kinase
MASAGALAAALAAAIAAAVAPDAAIPIAIAGVLASIAALVASRPPAEIESPAVRAAIDGLAERMKRDVAGARRDRAESEQAREEKEEFLAAVSHALRTPLNSIQGFAEVLLSEIDGTLSPSQREDVEAISNAGTFLKELIDEVIDSSSRRTPAVARLEVIDVGEIVREVGRMVAAQKRDKSIEVVVDVAPDLPKMTADPRRVRQILLNLAGNAMKFTRAGRVKLVATVGDSAVRVAVEDTGPGIASAEHERIFRAFERVDTNRSRTEGWGLGLAIAREMAQWHGGRIEVVSEVGRGSTFTLVMPLGARR